jgi:D-3-phosphoglycerate dehydrogenase
MLSLLRRIPQSQKHVSEYKWDYTKFVGRQVKDLTIGIIGYGRLGKMMYNFCRAFGANVIVYDPYKINKEMPLEYLITHCDVISLHVHVTDETKYMINKNSLGLGTTSSFGSVKGDCYIINTSRGEIVNETDIVEGLKSGKITGYATDVVEDEFGDLTKSPIIKAMNEGENIIVTPHVGGMTIEGQTKAYEWSFNKL